MIFRGHKGLRIKSSGDNGCIPISDQIPSILGEMFDFVVVMYRIRNNNK